MRPHVHACRPALQEETALAASHYHTTTPPPHRNGYPATPFWHALTVLAPIHRSWAPSSVGASSAVAHERPSLVDEGANEPPIGNLPHASSAHTRLVFLTSGVLPRGILDAIDPCPLSRGLCACRTRVPLFSVHLHYRRTSLRSCHHSCNISPLRAGHRTAS